jgi:uncharacterized protein (TIGR03083 family)
MTHTHDHAHGHDHTHAHAELSADDDHGLLHEMNHRLARLAARLTPEQWTSPSLCEGWRVCDVMGHMTYGGSMPMRKTLPVLLFKYRGNLAKGSKMESIKMAESTDQARLITKFEASCEHPVGFGKIIKPRDLVIDHAIHELDIRRPLGIDDPLPAEVAKGALNAIATAKSKLFAPSKIAAGLHLKATDIDWESGPADAPTVEGPAEDLLLALGGRRAGLSALSGTGVDELSRRTLPA